MTGPRSLQCQSTSTHVADGLRDIRLCRQSVTSTKLLMGCVPLRPLELCHHNGKACRWRRYRAKILSGEMVKSINTLKDNVTLAAGSNVTITPSGQTTDDCCSIRGRRRQYGSDCKAKVYGWWIVGCLAFDCQRRSHSQKLALPQTLQSTQVQF